MIPLFDIQANILKGHGRKHVLCLFLQFSTKEKKLREWIAQFADQVTSAEMQENETTYYKDSLKLNLVYSGRLITGFYISAKGMKKLGINQDGLPGKKEDAFWRGMNDQGVTMQKLNDPAPDQWEPKYTQDIDAMIMLSHNELEKLLKEEREIERKMQTTHAFSETMKIVHRQKGEVLYHGRGNAVEHFGYTDGISQPELKAKTGDYDKALCQKLIFDKNYGSYLVFRKLEQNVKHFNYKVGYLARQAETSREAIGAQVIGRHKNGEPLTLVKKPKSNDFSFAPKSVLSDRSGRKCPLHSHIRKVNPRKGHKGKEEDISIRQFVRRGVTYGNRKQDLSDEPTNGVGLLFMCYQKSIVEQFEHMQSNWCNNPDFPIKDTGIDPLIGSRRINGNEKGQKWNKEWGLKTKDQHQYFFDGTVRLKGGEYFYCPSISWIKNLNTKTKSVKTVTASATAFPTSYVVPQSSDYFSYDGFDDLASYP